MVKTTLLDWLCPEHRTPLVEREGTLKCESAHNYTIRDGIPRFVPESNYSDHFGTQWNHYRHTQLDSHTGSSITKDRLRRCLGEELWANLAGKVVLECGCGAGRFTEILLTEGASVVSVDLSSAVEANAANFPVTQNHIVAQADINSLPLAYQEFDIVLCLGVVQHTPSPEKTIKSLYSHVAPGGALVIDHYTGRMAWYSKSAWLFRAVLKRLPDDRAMRATNKLVDLFLPIHQKVRTSRLGRSVVHRISPILSYYTVFPQLNDNLQREWSLLDTHDSLTDWYKHWRTRDQIYQAIDRLGMVNIWCEYGGNGVEARAYRPLHEVAQRAGEI